MANLIKADLLRIVKDKLFLILCIIAAAMAFVLPLFYLALGSLFVTDNVTVREMFNATDLALAAFSPFSNFGLVLAIFMCIIIAKDFGNGTVRNKLIMGKTRLQVYLSNVITSLIVIVGVVLAFALLQFMVSTIFFNSGFTKESTGYVLQCFLYQVLGWIVLALAINFYATVMKNAGLSIITYVIIGLVLVFAGTIMSTIASTLESLDQVNQMYGEPAQYENAIKVIKNISAFNFVGEMSTTLSGSMTSILGMGSEVHKFTGAYIAEYLSSVIVCGAAFGGFGYLIFRKKDLK